MPPRNADDLRAAVTRVGQSAPLAQIGSTLASVGGWVEDAAATSARTVARVVRDPSGNLGAWLHPKKDRR